MSISVDLQSPFEYSLKLFLLFLAVILVPLIIALIIKLIKRGPAVKKVKKEKPKPQPAKNSKERLRAKYLAIIEGIRVQYDDSKIDSREAYIQLSKAVRGFVHEVTGANTENMTLSEIQGLGMPELHELIAVFYKPEFAYDSEDKNIKESFESAERLVGTWN